MSFTGQLHTRARTHGHTRDVLARAHDTCLRLLMHIIIAIDSVVGVGSILPE